MNLLKKYGNGINALDFYYNHYPRQSLDVNYGIRVENGDLLIGEQPVKVEDNKIIINGKEYVSTPNLWTLIMEKSPDMVKIDDKTLQEYKRLIADAGVAEYVEKNYEGVHK